MSEHSSRGGSSIVVSIREKFRRWSRRGPAEPKSELSGSTSTTAGAGPLKKRTKRAGDKKPIEVDPKYDPSKCTSYSDLSAFIKTKINTVVTSHPCRYEGVIALFKEIDTNNDGRIDCKDIKSYLLPKNEAATDSHIAGIMYYADANCDGELDFAEFMACNIINTPPVTSEFTPKQVESLYSYIRTKFSAKSDPEQKGILKSHLARALHSLIGDALTEEEINAFFRKYDRDEDYQWTLEELRSTITGHMEMEQSAPITQRFGRLDRP